MCPSNEVAVLYVSLLSHDKLVLALAMSKGRAAKWAAQRAGWKLANRGDTHFAADRRLYNQQMNAAQGVDGVLFCGGCASTSSDT